MIVDSNARLDNRTYRLIERFGYRRVENGRAALEITGQTADQKRGQVIAASHVLGSSLAIASMTINVLPGCFHSILIVR